MGCVREENCNLCDGLACESCSTFSSECDRCIADADLVNGECQCAAGVEQYDINLDICIGCPTSCQSCEADNVTCTECKENFALMSHAAICVPDCPTGYNKQLTERQCVLSTSIAVCEAFDTKNFVNNVFIAS